jgi:aromatic ring-opening dioxygenase catalytic subunit (LigB family)
MSSIKDNLKPNAVIKGPLFQEDIKVVTVISDKKTLAYQLGETLSRNTDHYLLMTAKRARKKTFSLLRWAGEVTPQKWMNFYTKVLSRFVTGGGLKLKVEIEVISQEGVSQQKVEQTKVALRGSWS